MVVWNVCGSWWLQLLLDVLNLIVEYLGNALNSIIYLCDVETLFERKTVITLLEALFVALKQF